MSGFQKLCMVVILPVIPACRGEPFNRVLVVDYRSQSAPLHSYEDFDEAYYGSGPDGMVEVVLRKQSQSAARPTESIVQIVHVRTFWKAQPGRTYADDTMINAHVSYVIFDGGSGVAYDGGGFFRYTEDSTDGVLTGTLTGGDLQPLRINGTGLRVFDRASISGRFKAYRDRRRATRIANHVNRALGPPPRFEADRGTPDY